MNDYERPEVAEAREQIKGDELRPRAASRGEESGPQEPWRPSDQGRRDVGDPGEWHTFAQGARI